MPVKKEEVKNGKSLVLSVSAKSGCYRHIQISKSVTLEELAEAILDSFNFIADFCGHAFFMDNRAWSYNDAYYNAETDEYGDEQHTCDYTLKQLNLKKGDAFKFVFDFGADWRFQCKVLREVAEDTPHEGDDLAILLRRVGDSPNQLERYEEWAAEEDE